MTENQAKYQARRAQAAEYKRVMNDPHSAGRHADRQDSAWMAGKLAYMAKITEWRR